MKQGVANFAAQMLGSICGAGLLLAGSSGSSGSDYVPRDFTGGLGSNAVNPRYSVGTAFVNEMMMTFLLLRDALILFWSSNDGEIEFC